MAFLALANIAGESTLGAAVTDTTGTQITTAASGVANLFAVYEKAQLPGHPLVIAIDTEFLIVTSVVDATHVNVTRGAFGTTAATHSNAAPIHVVNPLGLYKMLAAAIVAAAPGS